MRYLSIKKFHVEKKAPLREKKIFPHVEKKKAPRGKIFPREKKALRKKIFTWKKGFTEEKFPRKKKKKKIREKNTQAKT